MYRNIILAATLLSMPATMLAGGDNDKSKTLLSVDTPSTVTISETPQGMTVEVSATDGSSTETLKIVDYDRAKTISTEQRSSSYAEFLVGAKGIGIRPSSHWDVFSGGVLIGLVKPVDQPAGYTMRWSKSFEIGWLNALGVRYRNRSMGLSLGIGFDWRNYKSTGSDNRMVLDPASGIALAPYPDGATDRATRIKVFSLGFPLLYTQNIPGTTLSLTAGAILNLNTHASLLTTYRNSLGDHIEEYSEGIGRRKVTYDLIGSISFYHGIGLYIRYSPKSVLQGAGCPAFHPMSIGLSLLM